MARRFPAEGRKRAKGIGHWFLAPIEGAIREPASVREECRLASLPGTWKSRFGERSLLLRVI